jgi:hypothetical protein
LIQNLNLSYNNLASIAIDQEGTMMASKVATEKKHEEDYAGTNRR